VLYRYIESSSAADFSILKLVEYFSLLLN